MVEDYLSAEIHVSVTLGLSVFCVILWLLDDREPKKPYPVQDNYYQLVEGADSVDNLLLDFKPITISKSNLLFPEKEDKLEDFKSIASVSNIQSGILQIQEIEAPKPQIQSNEGKPEIHTLIEDDILNKTFHGKDSEKSNFSENFLEDQAVSLEKEENDNEDKSLIAGKEKIIFENVIQDQEVSKIESESQKEFEADVTNDKGESDDNSAQIASEKEEEVIIGIKSLSALSKELSRQRLGDLMETFKSGFWNKNGDLQDAEQTNLKCTTGNSFIPFFNK